MPEDKALNSKCWEAAEDQALCSKGFGPLPRVRRPCYPCGFRYTGFIHTCWTLEILLANPALLSRQDQSPGLFMPHGTLSLRGPPTVPGWGKAQMPCNPSPMDGQEWCRDLTANTPKDNSGYLGPI